MSIKLIENTQIVEAKEDVAWLNNFFQSIEATKHFFCKKEGTHGFSIKPDQHSLFGLVVKIEYQQDQQVTQDQQQTNPKEQAENNFKYFASIYYYDTLKEQLPTSFDTVDEAHLLGTFPTITSKGNSNFENSDEVKKTLINKVLSCVPCWDNVKAVTDVKESYINEANLLTRIGNNLGNGLKRAGQAVGNGVRNAAEVAVPAAGKGIAKGLGAVAKGATYVIGGPLAAAIIAVEQMILKTAVFNILTDVKQDATFKQLTYKQGKAQVSEVNGKKSLTIGVSFYGPNESLFEINHNGEAVQMVMDYKGSKIKFAGTEPESKLSVLCKKLAVVLHANTNFIPQTAPQAEPAETKPKINSNNEAAKEHFSALDPSIQAILGESLNEDVKAEPVDKMKFAKAWRAVSKLPADDQERNRKLLAMYYLAKTTGIENPAEFDSGSKVAKRDKLIAEFDQKYNTDAGRKADAADEKTAEWEKQVKPFKDNLLSQIKAKNPNVFEAKIYSRKFRATHIITEALNVTTLNNPEVFAQAWQNIKALNTAQAKEYRMLLVKYWLVNKARLTSDNEYEAKTQIIEPVMYDAFTQTKGVEALWMKLIGDYYRIKGEFPTKVWLETLSSISKKALTALLDKSKPANKAKGGGPQGALFDKTFWSSSLSATEYYTILTKLVSALELEFKYTMTTQSDTNQSKQLKVTGYYIFSYAQGPDATTWGKARTPDDIDDKLTDCGVQLTATHQVDLNLATVQPDMLVQNLETMLKRTDIKPNDLFAFLYDSTFNNKRMDITQQPDDTFKKALLDYIKKLLKLN